MLSTAKPGAPAFRCAMIHDPRYQEPLVLATTLPVSAYALWCLSRDRWPIEQMPLAAKQISVRPGRLCSVVRDATDCQRCHKLTFDPRYPQAPHGVE